MIKRFIKGFIGISLSALCKSALALVLLSSNSTLPAPSQGSNVTYYAIIANASNSSLPPLNSTIIKNMFLGREQYATTTGIVLAPVYNTASPGYNIFSQTFFNWSAAELHSYWSNLIFSGQANPPTAVDSDIKALKYVVNNTNAISYVPVQVLFEHPKLKQEVKTVLLFRAGSST